MAFTTPIAFFLFNRPDETARVFREIAKVRPTRLLVVADGARQGRPGEPRAVEAARAVVDQVDWPCDLQRNFSSENLGCKQRIASGLSWVFRTVEEAILLEDDCLPDPSFFPYCEALLERFRDDTRISVISGGNFQDGRSRTPYSYYFSKYFHCWGWASWRRVWQHYDPAMESWPQFERANGLTSVADSPEEEAYWRRIFDLTYRGEIDTWDYQWLYNCWTQSGLTVLPDVNLISNIGFGTSATHTSDANHVHANRPTQSIGPLVHPPMIVRHKIADRYTLVNNFLRKRAGVLRRWRAQFRNQAATRRIRNTERAVPEPTLPLPKPRRRSA